MTKHPTEDALIQFAFGREDADEATRQHVDACQRCREFVESCEPIRWALGDRETWKDADELLDRRRDNDDLVLSLSDRIDAEDAEAEAALSTLIGEPILFIRRQVGNALEFQNGGAVRVLCRAANMFCARQPAHARDLADAAIAIADRLPLDTYPGEYVYIIRGMAWLERANALRFESKHGAALVACQRAEERFQKVSQSGWQFARVQFLRATVLRGAQRYDEAIALGSEAAAMFEIEGDEQRARAARMVVGASLQRLRQFRRAKAMYERILKGAQEDDDIAQIAYSANHLGSCEIELKNFDAARSHLDFALELFTTLGSSLELRRVHWNIARLMAARGDLSHAKVAFATIEREFSNDKLTIEAAQLALHRAEILVVEGDQDEVRRICEAAVREFEEAKMYTSALTALMYLQEAAQARKATVAHVAHVREFIGATKEQPDLLFAPLPADDPSLKF